MIDSPLEDRPDADDVALLEPSRRREDAHRPDCPDCPERQGRVGPEDVARFVRDPVAFAAWAGAPTPEAFVKAYLEGLERRLSGVVGTPPGERLRLATLTAHTLPVGDLVETKRPREGGGELDLSPRMGPVLVACAVVQAAAAVVAAGCAVYTAMSHRDRY
jgi:hypothetical protein